MKTLRSICPCLLTFPMVTVAQYRGGAVKIEPAQPQPGQIITITYRATGSKLAKAIAVDGIVYGLPAKGEPVAQGFNPAKMGTVYTVTDTVKGFALLFETGKAQ